MGRCEPSTAAIAMSSLNLPAHAHQAIQACFNQHSGGVYAYRKSRHEFPTGSLTVINSGEAHAPGHQVYFQQPASSS